MRVIQCFLNNSLRNYNYIVGSDDTKEAIFFDPYDISKTLPLCLKEGWQPRYLINTHLHYDHVRNNKEFLNLDNTAELKLTHGKKCQLGEKEEVLCEFTPGHMLDHDCFFLFNSSSLDGVITGDTVFNAGVGNCRNGGDENLLYETIRDIFIPLKDEVKIYPSHDFLLKNLLFAKEVDPHNEVVSRLIEKRRAQNQDEEFINTNIGEERLINPFFRAFQADFQKLHNKNEKELFLWLRGQRDKW